MPMQRTHARRPRVLAMMAGVAAAALVALTGCVAEDPGPDLPGVAVPLPDVADPIPIAELGDFTGVMRLEMGANCTGTLIDTGVQEGPAYIITNGHCTGGVGRAPQRVTTAEEWFGPGYLLNTFDNPNPLEVTAAVLEYSTMRGRDVAIVKLKESLGALRALGINPVSIIDEEPAAGTIVRNIAAPVQGLDHDEWVLRGGDCTLSAQTDLLESHWLWSDAWANDCPGVIQGSSGSPLFTLNSDGTPEAIAAVINTTTWGSSHENGGLCFINRPCEIREQGIEMVKETSYAVSVAGIGRCFDHDGEFALGGSCPLETNSVWASFGGGIFRGGTLANAAGITPHAELVVDPSLGERAPVRTTLIELTNATACTDPAVYEGAPSIEVPSTVDPWDPGYVLPVALPEEEGHFALCAVAGNDYAGAAAVVFEVDRTPPMFAAGASVEDLGEGNVAVQPFLNPPEIATVRFTWVPGDAECPATDQFQDFFIIPLMLESDKLPATYCVYALDAAGNSSGVTRVPIDSR